MKEQKSQSLPKVSIITPSTMDREFFNNRCKYLIGKQDYPNIEHIFLFGEGSIGNKRNMLCDMAKGEIILHADSDDLLAHDFVSQSVRHLQQTGSDVTGLKTAYFFDGINAWLYDYQSKFPYVIGSGMCYLRSVWERNKFEDTSSGEDRLFLRNAGKVVPHGYFEGFIASIHPGNTESHKAIKHHYFKLIDSERVKAIYDRIMK